MNRRARRSRAVHIARKMGFIGQIEYHHLYSQTGGAQYGRGTTAQDDVLTVYAEAFERDADPEEPAGGIIMIGVKKLSTIRQELLRALAATASDPIVWLDKRMATPKHTSPAKRGSSEVVESLRRILEPGPKSRQHARRIAVRR
jgi:hypothetical protein